MQMGSFRKKIINHVYLPLYIQVQGDLHARHFPLTGLEQACQVCKTMLQYKN